MQSYASHTKDENASYVRSFSSKNCLPIKNYHQLYNLSKDVLTLGKFQQNLMGQKDPLSFIFDKLLKGWNWLFILYNINNIILLFCFHHAHFYTRYLRSCCEHGQSLLPCCLNITYTGLYLISRLSLYFPFIFLFFSFEKIVEDSEHEYEFSLSLSLSL